MTELAHESVFGQVLSLIESRKYENDMGAFLRLTVETLDQS